MTAWVLTGCGVALASAFAAMVWLGDLTVEARAFVLLFALAAVAYALAVARVFRRPPTGSRALIGILAAGLLMRVLLWPTPPTLSTDLYRYVWDGRLVAAGVSPYRFPPNAPELVRFRDGVVYPRLNHVDWRTIYPPGAQTLFAAVAWVAPSSPLAFKLLVGAFDLTTMGLLLGWLRALGRPAAWVLVYAWHPLVVVELAGSGHLDAVVLATSVGALWAATRGREGWAGALVGVGALVKLYPVLLLPAVWQRRPVRALTAFGAVIGAGYAFYASEGPAVFGSLGRYVREEEFNGGVRVLLERGLAGLGGGSEAARLVPLALLGLVAGLVGLLGRQVPTWRRARWLAGGYLLVTPNLFPWYALWLVPILAVAPAWPWLGLSLTVGLVYVVFAMPVWHIPAWVTAAEVAPLALGLLAAAWPRLAVVRAVTSDGAVGGRTSDGVKARP